MNTKVKRYKITASRGYFDLVPDEEGTLAKADTAQMLAEALEYAVEKYGKPGGPWNVPSDPGGWLERARSALAAVRGDK